jgi:hypothetical protein
MAGRIFGMLGGEFQHHGPQVSVECLNQDPKIPPRARSAKPWTISRRRFTSSRTTTRRKVHDLLISTNIRKPVHARPFPCPGAKPLTARPGVLHLARPSRRHLGHRPDHEGPQEFRRHQQGVSAARPRRHRMGAGIEIRARRQHGVEGLQIDAANRKPRHGRVRRRPADVVERHGLGGRLGAGGIDGPDGDVIRPGVERALRLRGACVENRCAAGVTRAVRKCACGRRRKNLPDPDGRCPRRFRARFPDGR